jgi:hypothetical protein
MGDVVIGTPQGQMPAYVATRPGLARGRAWW